MNFINNIKKKIDIISESFFIFSSFSNFLNIILNFNDYYKRKKYYKNLNFKKEKYDLEKLGYIKKLLKNNSLMNELKQIVINNTDIKNNPNKYYLKTIDINPFENEIIKKFILSNDIYGVVTKYFGYLPLLNQCSIWITNEQQEEYNSSQLFHIDHDDTKHLKFFLNIEEIDETSGPFTFYNKIDSKKIYKKINKFISLKKFKIKFFSRNKKFEDNYLHSIIPNKNLINNIGAKGMYTFVDTAKCYHYGGRIKNKPRIIFHLHFISPYTYFYNLNKLANHKDKINTNKLEDLLFAFYK